MKKIRTIFTIASLLISRISFAAFGTGDSISGSLNTGGAYIRNICLILFTITLSVEALRMVFDRKREGGFGTIAACIFGILICVLAPVIVETVSGWAGGGLGF